MKLHRMAFAFALLLLVAVTPALSQVHVDIGVRFGPPAPRHEVVVARPFSNAVWVKGHWAWNEYADRYVWVRGHWIAQRPAYVWVDGSWRHGPRGWYWSDGRWERQKNREQDRGYNRGRKGHDRSGQMRGFGNERGG
jgi:DNA-binding transcriptional LysR family regulator